MSDICDKCLKSFTNLAQHKKRKNPCCPPKSVILKNTAVSLFSGCGGDTLGLERAGFKVVGFSELKKTYKETHLKNFPDSKPILDSKGKSGDITKIESSQFSPFAGVDIVFAGFPCQGFSHAGKKQQNDPRNQLYLQFVRAVKEIKPLFIIGENVQGLERMKSGPLPTDPMVIDNIRKAFAEIGYTIAYKVYEATTFGVPQKRKRVLIIGWDTSRVTINPTSFWSSVDSLGKPLVSLRSFISNSLEGAYKLDVLPENFAVYALPVAQDAVVTGSYHPFIKLKADENLLSCCKRDSAIHSEIIDLDAPSKTIICTYGHQPRLLLGLKKPDGTAYIRTLVPDELKQIQGFPADYKLTGSYSERVIQVGNAVPPPMIEAIALAIRNTVVPNI